MVLFTLGCVIVITLIDVYLHNLTPVYPVVVQCTFLQIGAGSCPSTVCATPLQLKSSYLSHRSFSHVFFFFLGQGLLQCNTYLFRKNKLGGEQYVGYQNAMDRLKNRPTNLPDLALQESYDAVGCFRNSRERSQVFSTESWCDFLCPKNHWTLLFWGVWICMTQGLGLGISEHLVTWDPMILRVGSFWGVWNCCKSIWAVLIIFAVIFAACMTIFPKKTWRAFWVATCGEGFLHQPAGR